jgi:hypothetical protein
MTPVLTLDLMSWHSGRRTTAHMLPQHSQYGQVEVSRMEAVVETGKPITSLGYKKQVGRSRQSAGYLLQTDTCTLSLDSFRTNSPSDTSSCSDTMKRLYEATEIFPLIRVEFEATSHLCQYPSRALVVRSPHLIPIQSGTCTFSPQRQSHLRLTFPGTTIPSFLPSSMIVKYQGSE